MVQPARCPKDAGVLGSLVPALVVAALLIAPGAALGTSLPPDGKDIATVYCNKHRHNCTRVYGAGPSHYGHAPRGYSRRLRCRWYDTGYGSGLGVVKIYCIRRAG